MIKTFFTLTAFFLLLTSSRATELSSEKLGFIKPSLDLGLSAFSVKEDALLSRGSAAIITGHFGYVVDENLKINISPVASFISGQQTSRDPQSPLTNSIYLNEASLEYDYSQILVARIGTLYQKDFLPGISGYSKAFPSAGAKIENNLIDTQKIEFEAQVAVPTSSGLASTTSELESNSSLYSGTLILKSDWSKQFNSKLSYSHFVFNGLSSAMASDSLQKGNTVVKVGSSSAYFVYKYSGDEVRLNFDFNLFTSFGINMDTSFIKNSLAPSDINAGYSFSLGLPIKLNSKYSLRPIVEHFHIESDAMVATFVDTNIGRTNRDGFHYGINLETAIYNLQFIYSESKLIQSNPFQSADKSVFLTLSLNNLAL